MTFPSVSVDGAGKELNRLHSEIEKSLRSTVEYAIRAGEILSNVKEKVGRGEFLPWLNSSVSFNERTAQRYMKVFEHADKCDSVSDLQEAYRVVEQIETQERQTENQKAMQRVREFNKTGTKPEGWRRGTDDKLAKEETDRDERIERAKQSMNSAADASNEERAAMTKRQAEWAKNDEAYRRDAPLLDAAVQRVADETRRRREFKERIKVSQSGESDQFIEALMDYLDDLENDNRRIEACQNIIKVCRNVAAELQREHTAFDIHQADVI